jgi:DNA polymerase III subunit alpha
MPPPATWSEQRGGNAPVRLRIAHASGEADLVLGRDFLIDAELAARVERLPGVTAVRLSAEEKPRLALVG